MSIIALVRTHDSKFDRDGNQVFVERRAHADCGPESPFEFREQNSPPPDAQAPATSITNTRSRHHQTRK